MAPDRYVGEPRRPRNTATNATREPTANGGGVFHSTDLISSYQAVVLSMSGVYAATVSRGGDLDLSQNVEGQLSAGNTTLVLTRGS